MLAKLPHKLVTKQLRLLLDDSSYPNYKDVTQQNLFFVILCLQEGIHVENDFAEEVVTRIFELVNASPYFSQRGEAVQALGALLGTGLYDTLSRDRLRAIIATSDTSDIRTVSRAERAFYRDGFGEERLEGVRLLTNRFWQGKLSLDQQIDITKVIAVRQPDEAAKLLVARFQIGDLRLEQKIQVAKAIYHSYPIKSGEQLEGIKLLIVCFWQEELNLDQQIQIAHSIYAFSDPGSEEHLEGARLLTARFRQDGLTLAQQVQVAQIVYELSDEGSNERSDSAKLFITLAQEGKLTISQQILAVEIIYNGSLYGSTEQKYALQIAWQLIQSQDIPIDQRLRVAIMPCSVFSDNFSDRVESLHMLLSLTQGDSARRYINQVWKSMPFQEIEQDRPEENLSVTDIGAIYELAKMDVLPERVRDQMYGLLNRVVAVRGTVEIDEDEDD